MLTVGMALFCAAAIAALMTVNCAEPSAATVIAVGLVELEIAEDVEDEDEETVNDAIKDSDEVAEVVDEETDVSAEELVCAAAIPNNRVKTNGRMMRTSSDCYVSITQSSRGPERGTGRKRR